MSSDDKIRQERIALLLAYADGELDKAHATELEASLTDTERAFIKCECLFKQDVARQLGQEELPAAAWNRITRQVQNTAKPTAPKTHRFHWVFAGTAAAVVLVVLALQLTRQSEADDLIRRSAVATVADFEKAATTPADPDRISRLLESHGLSLDLSGVKKMMAMPRMGMHETYLLGARTLTLNGQECVSILFNCCGNAVQIVLTHVNSPVANALAHLASQASIPGQFILERDVGAVHAIFIGMHDARGLLRLLSSPA